MGPFATVVIRKTGGHYRISQDGEELLVVPQALFEQYEAEAVFPPAWRNPGESTPLRRLFWNPQSREFLMVDLSLPPARAGESFGGSAFRCFLQGFWIPAPPLLLLRPYWNPPDPYDPFDENARRQSFEAQWRFLDILRRLRPPEGWTAVLNAVTPYLEALGVALEAPDGEPEEILELSLTPPGPLRDESVRAALLALATEQAGHCFPVLREGVLVGVHALSLPELHDAETLLLRAGILYQLGPFRPH